MAEELKEAVVKDDRDAEWFRDIHEWSRTHRGTAVELFVRSWLGPFLAVFYRVRHIGGHNIPKKGGALMVANHGSHLDHFFIEIWLRWVTRHPHFQAKSQLYSVHPASRFFFKYAGTFPIRRGAGGDDDSFETARICLEKGFLVGVYPEGGRTRTGEIRDARRGAGRIALESGAPVIPVAIHGSVHARQWRRNWPRGKFPPVTVWFGEPMHFGREPDAGDERHQEVVDEVWARVREMHAELEERLGPGGTERRGRVVRDLKRRVKP